MQLEESMKQHSQETRTIKELQELVDRFKAEREKQSRDLRMAQANIKKEVPHKPAECEECKVVNQ